MKIISWNVAGLRACLKKGFEDFFNEVDADVFCLQETKLLEEQLEFIVAFMFSCLFDKECNKYDYKEISRNGQVFILYHRVEFIEEKRMELKRLIPGAKIIDIRDNYQFNLGSIPTSINIPMNFLLTNPDSYLTKNNIELQKYINVDGEDDEYVLKCAYVNSYLSTGYKNIVDKAINENLKTYNDFIIKESRLKIK